MARTGVTGVASAPISDAVRRRDGGLDARVGRATTRPRGGAPPRTRHPAGPESGPARDPGPGRRLRPVPHRPAPRRGRPPPTPDGSGARAPGRRQGRRPSGGRRHRFAPGDRVGIAWLRGTCGACRWCRRGAENLCPDSRTPAGTPTAASPSTPSSRPPTPTRFPTRSTTSAWRRCCAPASSATARCAGRSCRRAGGSASTVSARAPTSPRRSRWHRAPRSTS